MSPDRYQRLKRILQDALERDAAARGPFLDDVCLGEPDLRAEVESLLRHHHDAASFLAETPIAATLPAQTAAEPLPRIEHPSALLRLSGGLPPGAGIQLSQLPVERPLPLIRSGAEKYEILRLIGQGGMGRVYLAQDQDLCRPVALKMLREGTAELMARFLEEAQVMGQLQHPNILPVLDLGVAPGDRLYYTMPVVHGQSVEQLITALRRGEPLAQQRHSLTRLMQIYLAVLDAVGYAHARGVVHRDLKPANVMVGEHGEVQVLDWGLARVFAPGSVTTAAGGRLTLGGMTIGTPAYMSPEQIRGESAGPRSDLYALGVVLYELLTLELPFGSDRGDTLVAHLSEAPVPPRARAPGRRIPLELEAACLRALAKEPEGRPASAEALAAEIQGWLEGESDRERRHALAEERAETGGDRLESYRRLYREIGRQEQEVEVLRKRFEPWQDEAEKAQLFAAEDRLEAARDERVRMGSALVGTLTEALGFERDNSRARGFLADYYWLRFQEAEAIGDRRTRDFFADLVHRYHDGRYARELDGSGSLRLASDPPGAEVWLHALIPRYCRLVPDAGRRLGVTPLAPTRLEMGSYLVMLRSPGYRDVAYPVFLPRNRDWTGVVRLRREEEIGNGFVLVPAGPFLWSGTSAMGLESAGVESWLDDFRIAVHPVTVMEYLEFLHDLTAREGLAAAERRAPRATPTGQLRLVVRDGQLDLPSSDAEGDRWHPRWPVIAISWFDAEAYCEWRSARDGRQYRLPSQMEFEKAGRGVDGRIYPWGNRFDASLCNRRESHRERPQPVPIDDFPTDCSVYGVRGIAGNVGEWTSTLASEGSGVAARDWRVVVGGSWSNPRRSARLGGRSFHAPANVFDDLGFRLLIPG